MIRFLEERPMVRLAVLVLILISVGGLFAYGRERYRELEKDFSYAEEEFQNARESLERRLASSTAENESLVTLLQARVSDFQNEKQEFTARLSFLEKLQSLDPQLLQKYSKIYFLNENYFPSEIALVDAELILNKEKPVQIHSRVKPYLESLMHTAGAEHVDIKILSGYRSFEAQKSIKSNYKITYGSGSNRFSADQGYSEHQLGTTIDFTNRTSGEILSGFDKTPAYEWLLGNAHRFGFILSYPKGNNYYIFEPWHWRFVGVALASRLRAEGKIFYDLPQRDIDSYLAKIFD